MCRNVNRKSQNLSSLKKMTENLQAVSVQSTKQELFYPFGRTKAFSDLVIDPVSYLNKDPTQTTDAQADQGLYYCLRPCVYHCSRNTI